MGGSGSGRRPDFVKRLSNNPTPIANRTQGDQVFIPDYSGVETYLNDRVAFGEIYVKDGIAVTTLNSAAKVQVTSFDTNGYSNNCTPDHTNDHITISKPGKYLVTISLSVQNDSAQSHQINFGLFKNNGVTQFNNVHSHRNLSGGSGDVGSMTLNGIVDVSLNDTIELWANTDRAGDTNVILSDLTMSILQIGV